VRRVVVITGASSGIGREAAIELARRGWSVAVAGRNPERTEAVAKQIGADAFVADFDSLDSVTDLATALLNRFDSINALVNNAGGIVGSRAETSDGFEATWQRNVLGSMVLTEALLPRIAAVNGRIVHTTSIMHRQATLRLDDLNWDKRRYGSGWRAYADAKLGVMLYARDIAARHGLDSYPVHPGYVHTGFGPGTKSADFLLKATRKLQISAQAGAAPLVHLVDTPELGVPTGTYFDGLTPLGKEHPLAKDVNTVSQYVAECFARVGLDHS